MNYHKVEFKLSAAKASQFPRDGVPQIAFAGKSNVGKSSVINRVLQRKNLAYVGSSPGKTIHINYFLVDETAYLVDLPGYGYAKVSKSVSEGWGEMMERYLQSRENLVKVIQLVDIRHAPSKQDVEMYNYLRHYGLDGLVVATKADKISRNQMQKQIKLIRQTLKLTADDKVIPVSSLKKTGWQELLDEMESILEA